METMQFHITRMVLFETDNFCISVVPMNYLASIRNNVEVKGGASITRVLVSD